MLAGSLVALVTPMTKTKEIDWDAFEHLVQWQIEEGTNGLILGGTTGEGSTLSLEEKRSLFAKGVEVARGRIPIIAGTGSNCTQTSVAITQEAKALGVSAAILIVPYYNRPTPSGCIAHFEKIATVHLPLILYHHPGRTGIRLSLETIARICEIPQVVAIKEASGDVKLATELVHQIDKSLFSGDDLLSLAHLSIGFSGVISVIGNLLPRQWGDFVRSPTKKAFSSFYNLCQSLALETNPQGIKYALSLLGKCEPNLRLPLVIPEITTQNAIRESLTPLLRPVEV